MAHKLDPRYCNVFIDAHVLDPAGGIEDEAVDEILDLHEAEKFFLQMPHSVKQEIEHPNTPDDVKRRAARLLFSTPVPLTQNELDMRDKICALMQGNAKPGKHNRDAYHVVESAKYGGYFITNDRRILKKEREIQKLLSSLSIVTPDQFLRVFRSFEDNN